MLSEQTVSNRRAIIIVVIVCSVAVGVCGLLVVLRLTRPADGLMIGGYAQVEGHIGAELYVMRRYPLPIGLRADDAIVAIEDRSIEELGGDLFRPGAWGQSSIALDRPLAYRIRRDGQDLVVPVVLGIHPHHNLLEYWGVAIFALVYLGAGVFVFLKRPTEPVAGALLLSAGGEFIFNIAGTFPLQVSDLTDPLMFWYVRLTITGSIFLGYAGLIHFALAFPRPPRIIVKRRWLTPLVYVSPWAFFTGYLVIEAGHFPGVMAWYTEAWSSGFNLTLLLMLIALPVIAIWRYAMLRDAAERRRLGGLLLGSCFIAVVSLLLNRLPETFGLQPILDHNLRPLLYSLFPVLLAVSILRYRLWGIEVILNRVLVYGALTAGIMAIYLAVVVVAGQAFYAPNNLLVSMAATGLVAIVFEPGRAVLQRGVNRLMYGDRDDPYTVIARLGRRLETTFSTEAILPTIAETVGQALKLPYVGLTLKRGDIFEVAATYPARSSTPCEPIELLVIPLMHQQTAVGQLMLAPRSSHETFSPADRRLLDDLARQAGLAAYNVSLAAELMSLTSDLQRSRERLVTIREEERRRLSRDLHDGLGPVLAGLHLNVNALHGVLRRDADCADQMLHDMQLHLTNALAEVRRLVYELRPPLLDALGLVGAIRHFADDHMVDSGLAGIATDGVRITIDAPESLPALPAAVEVAAYRIALEGMTNVVQHACAKVCTVRLGLQRQAEIQRETKQLSAAAGPLSALLIAPDRQVLCLEIADDGTGFTVGSGHTGLGLASMRERASELGGSCVIGPNQLGGVRVAAYLPIGAAGEELSA